MSSTSYRRFAAARRLGLRTRLLRLGLEQLETRTLLTSTLYVDFGDRFPVGGLTGTVGTLRTATSGVAGDPAVAGPNMDKDLNGDFAGAATDDEDGFTMVSFVNRYTTDGGNYTGGLNQLRADIMTFVRRFYDPYDIDVIELTATAVNVNGRMVQGAASLAEISSTLGANEAGVAKNNDGYVLLGNTIVHRPAGDGGDIDISTIWGGYASTIDMPSGNNSDNSAIGFIGPGAFSGGINAGGWANLIAHEAGHLFGFQHSLTTAPGGTVSPQIPTSEIMSYLGANGFNYFSRYPMVRGNNNTMNNDDLMATSPPAPAANRTPYDQWVNTASIGANGDYHYVTGTGAHDIITIATAGGNANISVQAFSDAAHTTALAVPGSAGASTTYSYTVALDRPLIVDGGNLNDRVIVDGDLGVTVTVRGMNGVDELIVMGKNAASGSYTPGTNAANGLDGNADRRGSVVIGTTTINFQEFEAGSEVTVQDLSTLTFVGTGSGDNLVLDSPSASENRISGSVASVGFVPLTLMNVTNTTVNAGGGGDDVTVNSWLGNPSLNGGLGIDSLTLNISGAAGTYTPGLPDAGTVAFPGGPTITFTSFEVREAANVLIDVGPLTLSSTTIDEDGTLIVSGDFVNFDTEDTHEVSIDWGEGLPQLVVLAAGDRDFSVPHQYLDDDPTATPSDPYAIQVNVTDEDNDSDSGGVGAGITVFNVDPVITSTTSSADSSNPAQENGTTTVSGTFSDVGTLDTHTVQMDWGDGAVSPATVNEVGGSGSFTTDHAYASGGIFTVTITLTDDDTGVDTAVETVFVTGAGIQEIDGQQVLFVIGTGGDDHVTINAVDNQGIKVHADFLTDQGGHRTFTDPIDQIRILLLGGDDHATIASNVSIPALIDGGLGNDHLNAGGAGSVVLGGSGNDTLGGSSGDDLLIGGDGVDRLVGNKGEDILIAGFTTFDTGDDDDKLANDAALMSILAEWNSSRSLAIRRQNISGTGVGPRLNANNFLVPGTTLFGDGDADVLTGGSDNDWFILSVEDQATDYLAGKDVANF